MIRMMNSQAPPAPATPVCEALSRAALMHAAGRVGDAERLYRGILATATGNGEALHGLGLIAQQAGALEQATELLRLASAAEPGVALYRTNLGNALQMRGLLAEAVTEYGQALELRPDSAAAWSNLGMALGGLGRDEEAVVAQERAGALCPGSAQIADNCGNALQAVGRLEEAVLCHRRSLGLDGRNAEVHGNLGLALAGLGRWEEAMGCLETALSLDSENARIQLARAQLQLLLGNFRQGWRNYEWRKRVHGERRLAGKLWNGEKLREGETLLLTAEQGLGDTIQFLRYLPAVEERVGPGVALVLEVQPALRRLAERTGLRVVALGEPLPPAEWHCPWMSLPAALGEEGACRAVGYLHAPAEALERICGYAEERGWAANEPCALAVGLVWAGNRAHVRDRFRSIPICALESLFAVPGVTFHSLQFGEAGAEGAGRLVDWRGAIADLADTAAVIERLDLVIGVDTAVVHLAGALGKPVWAMLPFWPDWRWGIDGEDCAWYPTMRLFRQRMPGDWAGVVERMRGALTELISRRGRYEG